MPQNKDLKEIIKILEESSKSYPFLDPDYNILIVEESETPIIIMNKKEYGKLWEKVTGEPLVPV
jgi:hypothetical protein